MEQYILHILCVCGSVALITQYEMHMRYILSVACPPLPYFSTLSHKRYDLREKKSY